VPEQLTVFDDPEGVYAPESPLNEVSGLPPDVTVQWNVTPETVVALSGSLWPEVTLLRAVSEGAAGSATTAGGRAARDPESPAACLAVQPMLSRAPAAAVTCSTIDEPVFDPVMVAPAPTDQV